MARWHLKTLAFATFAALAVSASTVETAFAADMEVTVAQGAAQGFLYLPFLVADHEGYFAENGVKVNTLQANGAAIMNALLAGKADIGSNTPATITAAAKGVYMPTIVPISRQFPADIILTTKVMEERGISPTAPIGDRIKALKGMNIGISSVGSTYDILLRYILPKYGLTPDQDVTLVPLGTAAAATAAMKTGAVDGYIDAAPSPQQAQADGLGTIFISLNNGAVPELAGYVKGWAATPDALKNKPEAVQAFVNAIAEALKFIQESPEKATAIAVEANPNLSADIFTKAYNDYLPVFPKTPVYSPEGLALNDTMQRLAQPSLGAVDMSKLVDNSFALVAAKKYGLSLTPVAD
ncbi:MAG TPA: ABC transporter substrate-binding protein [Devosiaceae bacterium]|jgi:NitT/TauT family transport system substrate-binding protein